MATSSSLIKTILHKALAEGVYRDVVTKSSNYYYFLGKTLNWSDETAPPFPTDSYAYERAVRDDIITMKSIGPSDVSFVIPRVNWTSGEIYDMYDDALSPDEPAPSGAVRLEDARFYVLTSDYNVYKCIFNANNGPSINQPTSTSTSTFSTGDGYLWKFMYTIPISLRNRFLTSDFIPVTTALKNQFYVDGEITQIIIDNPGEGYINPIVTITGNGYIKNNPYLIKSIVITNPGDGYTTTPQITFADPSVISGNELIATGEVTISGGGVSTASLLTAGYGYTGDPIAPVITVDPPILGAIDFLGNSAVLNGQIIEFDNRYYSVQTAGVLSNVGPTQIGGGPFASGTSELQYVAARAILSPEMEKTEADIDVVLDANGSITNVIINDGGIGYDNANIQIKEDITHPPTNSPDASYAVLTAGFNTGSIDTLQANVELLTVPGTIEAMKVINGGTGYGAATVSILGDGIGATATAQVAGGRVIGITMTNTGYGYTWTDVVIGGNGSGAIVRAIMSPLKGHGRNAIDELNANSIMFYSSIGRDSNHGMTVTNDYRKAGLLKNITEFNSNNKFKADVGSGCVLLTGNFDKTKLAYDQLLVLANAVYKKYRIVEFTDTQILLSVFNNFTINIGDTLLTTSKVTDENGVVTEPTNGYTIEVIDVQERTIDQFSGDFLFLSVREPFAPSEEQIITIRTILTI